MRRTVWLLVIAAIPLGTRRRGRLEQGLPSDPTDGVAMTAGDPPPPRRPLIPARLHALLPVAILALWSLDIDRVRLREMNDLGLISVMPLSALVLLLVLTVSFCLSLSGRPLRFWVPLSHVLVLVLILHGVTVLLEVVPRGAVVYRHAGIIDYIVRNESVDPSIDAYFNWPGFFGLGALISEATGSSPLAMGRWAPLAFNLLFLPMLVAIFRWASDDPRVTWLGLWVFYSANWVGQDYLSPQAVGFTLWLSMLALLLTWFTPRPAELAVRPSLRVLRGALAPRGLRARLRRLDGQGRTAELAPPSRWTGGRRRGAVRGDRHRSPADAVLRAARRHRARAVRRSASSVFCR